MTSDAVLSFPDPAQVDADRMDHIQPASGITALAPTVLPDCHLEELDGGGFFLAYTPAMQKIRNELRLVADLNIPLLILGESGTGKEIVARLVHQYSKRRRAPFMKVNCAAIPSELLESELFGFETGAFTGAQRAKPGKFELCHKGTLLLDEIGQMPPILQAKLLQVLQDGEFTRLGGRHASQVDVRILAATNIDMPRCIADKTFRHDLFYRLNTFPVIVPPLRQRREEIPHLIHEMLQRIAREYGCGTVVPSAAFIEQCIYAPWHGNVRELQNFLKRHSIVRNEDAAIQELTSLARQTTVRDLKSIVQQAKVRLETEAITTTLLETGGDRRRAASILNISRRALLNKIQQYGIAPSISHTKVGVKKKCA